jgi:acyl-CoA thioesterase YciA
MSDEQKEPGPAEPAGHAGPTQPAIRVMMMPKDTNGMGTIFGGIILSYIDLAGAVEAWRYATGPVVTAAVRGVEFLAPVFVGDLVSFYTRTMRIGRSSITVKVNVEVERRGQHLREKVTEAEVVYVQIGRDNRPTPLDPLRIAAAGLPPEIASGKPTSSP